MSTTIRNNLKVQNARNFLELIQNNKVYLWIGRDTPWTDENNPPVPKNDDADERSARTNIEYLIQMNTADAILGIPRYNWTFNQEFAGYSDTDPLLFTKNFFCITSSNNVYKCISSGNDGVSDIPSGTSTSSILTNDGYTWKFMFDLPTQISSPFLTNKWIPVPQGTQKSIFQVQVENSAVDAAGGPIGGHGKDAISELGGSAVIITKKIALSDLGAGFTHRQFGLLISPKLTDGTAATATQYVIEDSPTFDLKSGQFLMLSNHLSISSDDEFSENIHFTIKF